MTCTDVATSSTSLAALMRKRTFQNRAMRCCRKARASSDGWLVEAVCIGGV